jgi:hypothetical protein
MMLLGSKITKFAKKTFTYNVFTQPTNLGVGGSKPPRRANYLIATRLESRSSSAADQWPSRGETGIRIGSFSAWRLARTTVLSGLPANRSGNLVK